MIDYIFIGLVVKQSSEVAFWQLTVFCNIEYHKIKPSEKWKTSGMISIGYHSDYKEYCPYLD